MGTRQTPNYRQNVNVAPFTRQFALLSHYSCAKNNTQPQHVHTSRKPFPQKAHRDIIERHLIKRHLTDVEKPILQLAPVLSKTLTNI